LWGDKVIQCLGEAGQRTTTDAVENLVTVFEAGASLNDFMAKIVGTAGNYPRGSKIADIYFDGKDRTSPLGAIQIEDQFQVTIERVGITDFFNPVGVGIKLQNSWYNTFLDVCTRRCGMAGIEFGQDANDTKVIGGSLSRCKDGNITGYGLYFNGTDRCDTNLIIGMDLELFLGENQIACYLKVANYNKFYALRMEGNYGGIKCDASPKYNVFHGGTCSAIVDGGYYWSNANWRNRIRDSIDVDDQKTSEKILENVAVGTSSTEIPHYLFSTPRKILALPRSDVRVWRSANPTENYIYLQAFVACNCDIPVSIS